MSPKALQVMLGAIAREQQALTWTAKGLSVKEFAHRMEITERTAKKLKEQGMGRLDLHNTAQIVHHAIQQGWVVLGEVEK